jgi:hypothetical protein
MKATGKTTSPKDMADSSIPMEMSILENGRTTRPTEKEPIFLNAEPST